MKTLYTLIILVILSTSITAQPFVEQTSLNLPDLSYSSTQWGDYDNDGYLDFLICGRASTGATVTRLYKNNGNGSFTELALPEFTNSSYSKIGWGDVNNDGWLDFLLSNSGYPSNSSVYTNNQDGTFTKDTSVLESPDILGSLSFVDVDIDGDLDISIADFNAVHIYENTRSGFKKLPAFTNSNGSTFKSSWGDYNNDGYVDVITSSMQATTSLYLNNGNNTFTKQSVNFVHTQHGESSWSDYDNDGDLDVLITGNRGTSRYCYLYRNNANNSFSRVSLSATGVYNSSIAWGDYNNDGNSDFLYAGYNNPVMTNSKVFKNNGDNTFTEQSSFNLPNVPSGTVTWADYDNDGDLDMLITGNNLTKLYRNDCPIANSAPGAPTTLSLSTQDSITTFKWEAPTDDTTPSAALSYNLRVGTTPGGCEIVSPMSDSNGYRRIVGMGNAQLGTTYKLKNLPTGTYYWSVQAIDNAYAGGEFATEQSFTLQATNIEHINTKELVIYPNPTTSSFTITCDNFKKAELINTQGKVIRTFTEKQNNVSDVANGIYVLKIYTSSSNTQSKLIKK